MLEGTDKSATTDEHGQFRIADVPEGSYLLICRHVATDGTAYAFLRAVDARSGATTDIGIGEITPTGRIQGLATLADQTDHTGILAYVSGTSMQSRTDALGAFLIRDIPEGTYDIRFEREGYVPAKLAGIGVKSGETAVVADMVLNLSTGATGAITIDKGKVYSNSRTVTVFITASEDATLIQISPDPNFIGAAWNPIPPSRTWIFDSDGEKRLYAKFADANGLESAPVSDTIIIDTTPPINGSVVINSSASATNSLSVQLTLAATDATTAVVQMRIANVPDLDSASWEPYNPTRSWTLLPGDGTKTVYAQFRDSAGNETTQTISALILLDTTLPTGPSIRIQEGNYTNTRFVHLDLRSSGASLVKISESPDLRGVTPIPFLPWSLRVNAPEWVLSNGDGEKTLYASYLDEAGNESATVSATIQLDTIPPTTPVIFNQPQTTNQATFILTLSANSFDQNFKNYQLNGGQYQTWTDTVETSAFSFTLSQQGANVLYIRGKDMAGNVGNVASITIVLDTVYPVISNITVSALGTSATIQWNTDGAISGKVDYGTDTNYGSTEPATTFGIVHSVTLTGLTELTTYHYQIGTTDIGSNVTTSTDLTFKTGKEVRGNIAAASVWTEAGGPYVIVGDVGIPPAVTLTIEAGARIEYAGEYMMLIKGAVIANGTSSRPIIFTAVAWLPNSGATQLRFQEATLTDSQLSYVIFERANRAIELYAAPISYCSSGAGTGPKDSGYLTVSNATITSSVYTSCESDSGSNGLIIDSSIISNTAIHGAYAWGAKITIHNSAITNSTLTADAYHIAGLTISGSTVGNSAFQLGCCGAKIRLEGNTSVTDSTVSEGLGSSLSSSLEFSFAQLTNTSIDLPSAQVTISNSTIAYNSAYAGATRLKIGNGSLSYSRITGNGGGTGLEVTGSSGYSSVEGLSISYCDITGHDIGMMFSGGGGTFSIANSNINSNAGFGLKNLRTGSATVTNSYWGATTNSAIDALIYDGNDNINYGIVTYSPFSTVPVAGTGPRVPYTIEWPVIPGAIGIDHPPATFTVVP
ncbi:MAG: fibronectin type III domain-containing protein [Nitrospirae bacterium]|nr:fibronectin type III domain-containing protein [Nitrospirota bacterium]